MDLNKAFFFGFYMVGSLLFLGASLSQMAFMSLAISVLPALAFAEEHFARNYREQRIVRRVNSVATFVVLLLPWFLPSF